VNVATFQGFGRLQGKKNHPHRGGRKIIPTKRGNEGHFFGKFKRWVALCNNLEVATGLAVLALALGILHILAFCYELLLIFLEFLRL
jgi:hypothetical protein